MVRVILNLSTEEDSDNLGEKGGGKRYMALPQFELTVRVEKIKLCTVNAFNAVNGREEDLNGGRFEGRKIRREEDSKGGGVGVRMILFSLKLYTKAKIKSIHQCTSYHHPSGQVIHGFK
jgi:hypothetical protein